MHKQALTSRQQEQLSSLAQAEACGDAPRAKRLRHLIPAEKTKFMYQKLRRFRHSQSGGLTKLEVPASGHAEDPTTCTEWITVDTPLEIEQALRARNQRHFGQAEGTFPTVPPFSEWVNWTASTHVAELILEGQQLPSDDIDPLAKELLAHMQRRCSLDAIPATLTEDEWRDKIRAWPESTSTSPSGFHLTHSKALIARHNVSLDTPEGLELEKMRGELLSAQVSLLNLALHHQYSFERWKTVVNVMILKEPDNFRINKLRVIHLYEHDYNLLLAIKWRLLIQRATSQNLLHPGQFGGIPGRDAVIPTVIEELQYEISRASKRPMVHIDYDATACYDRIVIPFSSIIARGFGQHRSVVYIHASTLQEARYLLKTQLGVSESFYKHCQLFPIHGSGQGAGNSPGLWCCISSVLFTAFDSSAHGAQFASPDGQCAIHLFLIGFVDDTSCSVNDFYLPSPAPVTHYLNRAQHDAQRWNNVLSLSGGALNPAKCSYHVLYYDFTPSGLPVLKGGTFPPALTIQFSSATPPRPLLQLPASSPHKTLGVYKAPSGSSIRGYQALVGKATLHASTVSRNPLNKQDTWAYYHAIALPSLVYPLPSMSLSTSQCEAIQKELKRAILPKCGYNRNTPNAVVYGHSDYGGLEFRTLSVEQGLAQLQSLLSSLRSTGVAHKLACIAIMWAQHLAGTGISLFEDVQTPLPHLEPMIWIPSIRSFLASISCHLEVSLPSLIPPPQRLYDCHLMDLVLSSGFSPSQVRLINCCRLYLGVRLLSDVTVHDGTSLCPHVVAGRRPPHHFFKGLQPYQSIPGPTAWKLWRRALSLFTIRGSSHLRQPLGLWVVSGPALYREWVSYATYYPRQVYVKKQQEYEVYDFTQGSMLVYTGKSVPILPSSAVPIAVDYGGPAICALSSPTPPTLGITSSPPSSFARFVESLPDWERVLIQHCTFMSDGVFDFVSRIHAATTRNSQSAVVAASDGSAPGFRGTFGWSCALSDGTRLAQNYGIAPGYRTSSFRAELYGLLSFLRFLIRTHEFTATALPTHIHLYTDSKSAVARLRNLRQWPYFFPNMTMIPEWDILQAILTACRQLGESLRISHIFGHQDRHNDVSSLSLPAQLNVAADALATHAAFLHDGVKTTRSPMIAGSMVLLHSPMGTVTSRLRPVLRRLATAQASKTYLCQSNQWSPPVFNLVDWSSHGLSMRRWYHRKAFITKFVNNWLPLGHQVSRYKPFYPASCPSCGHPDEDRIHFLSCPSRAWIDPLLVQLQSVQDSTPTHPALFETLCLGLRHWNDPTLVPWPSFPSSISRLVHHQSRAGWSQLLFGRFVRAWAEIHDQFVADGAPPTACRCGEQWVARVTVVIWEQAHRQWTRRNEDRHGRDAITSEAALADQAGRELSYLYSLRLQVLPRDRCLFHASVEAHRAAMPSSSTLRQWILTWGPVIRQSALTRQSLHLPHTRPISSYFL